VDDATEMAWGIIANVSGGDWSQQSQEWRDAARRWHDAFVLGEGEAQPQSTDEGEPSYDDGERPQSYDNG
jgi:hypothetical protein